MKNKARKLQTPTGAKSSNETRPKFPYTNKPNSLRKFFEQIPQRPKPAKINFDLLKGWGLKDTNDQSIIRVLKALGFVGSNGEPTDRYTEFMTPGKGPAVLGDAIREVWAPLFTLSHHPYKEDDDKIRSYFNIHSGGSDATLALQIQTFKAACDYANLTTTSQVSAETGKGRPALGGAAAGSAQKQGQGGAAPTVHIDLHIHLPENKSRRDYEYIFEDIGRYILGRPSTRTTDE